MDTADVMTVKEVAALFRVAPETVSRWARAGRLPYMRWPNGHLRFRTDDVKRHWEYVRREDSSA